MAGLEPASLAAADFESPSTIFCINHQPPEKPQKDIYYQWIKVF
ncbi:hypothetical protein [Nioella ostreopsis]|nr:hypothetical protein [Nioella ostreopsis]